MPQLEKMPNVFTFALVDCVSLDAKLSKGRARKVILRGQVSVNGTVVRDPEMRVSDGMKIVFKP